MRRVYLSMAFVSLSALGFAQNSPYIKAVDEYVPAPGQFVNELPKLTENDTPETAAQACTKELAGDKQKGLITLGAYGGYITFHFDHPVINVEGAADFVVYGNAFDGSSEPGIVMVMKDENGNGKPDDTWYELSGSADVDSIGKVIYKYEITYTPNPMQPIPWTDNQGHSGAVQRVGGDYGHFQEYYPLWINKPLTFKGTLLPKNSYFNSQGWWVQNALRYGYVDNLPNEKTEGFNIENAVDANRKPVKLDQIDFVRVYCAVNDQCPKLNWVGELSTEVKGAEDLHPTANKIDAPLNSNKETTVMTIYTIEGKQIKELQRGLNIVKLANGKVRKVLVK